MKNRGGARGELGAPTSEHASPQSEGEKRFFSEIFAIYSTLKTIFFYLSIYLIHDNHLQDDTMGSNK